MSMEKIRSFIAFDVEDKDVIKRIVQAQEKLVKTGADLKLIKPENIHVTIRFLGNITSEMVNEVYEEMRKVSYKPFKIELRGLGAFPNLKYLRVIWVGIKEGVNELISIFNQLEPQLRRLGLKPDTKGFSPHITIARVRSSRHKTELAQQVKELADYEFGLIKGEKLRLKKSVLSPKGPVYSTLREVKP